MKEKLESQHLRIIRVPASGVVWLEDGKECLVGNKMFDVLNYSVDQEIYTLHGLFDDEEQKIMNSLMKASLPRDNERAGIIYQCTHLLFEQTELVCLSPSVMTIEREYTVTSQQLTERRSFPPFIPPDAFRI